METLGSKQVYANPWMTVREDTIRRPDGSTGIYGVVDSPDVALIIPADVDAVSLAARELREETGILAGRLTPLGTLDVAPGMFSQRCRVLLATDLTQGPTQRELEEQDMRSAWFTRADVEHMFNDGTITDAKSTAAYTLLTLHERSHV